MRCKRRGISSSLKMKFEALEQIGSSLDELAHDFGLGLGEVKTDFESWYGENIYSDDSTNMDVQAPFFMCFTTGRNYTCPVVEKRQLGQRSLDSSSGYSSGWMSKWKNRTPVKFSRCCGKQWPAPSGYEHSEQGGIRKVAKPVDSSERFTHGIQTLLMALEYVEKQEKMQPLSVNRLNNRMHVMDGDGDKAGEAAPDLVKLLEDQAVAKEPVLSSHHLNGIKSQEKEIVDEPVKEEEEKKEELKAEEVAVAPEQPTPEIKEESQEEEEAPSAPKDKEEVVEEAKPPSRSTTPKQEEEPQNSCSPPLSAPAVEVSRKRTLETKEQEPEASSGSDSDSSRKRNKVDQETETTPVEVPNNRETRTPVEDERERMISDFITEVSMTPDALTEASDRLTKEIESLGELAAAKEIEWNAILRVRKLKEEMLERLLRKKRLHCLEEQSIPERIPEHLHNKMPNNQMMMMMRGGPRFPDALTKQRPILPKPSPYTLGMNPREGRNGPIVDVKSIIDDYSGGYRARHPDSAPRRGRRARGAVEQRFSSNPSLISMANMALGTGASVRTVSDHVYNMGLDQSRREEASMKEAGKPNGAKPYPEVTLHPVSPPSLLHQVLTKSTPPRPASFSPTLARLLTAPERPPAPPPHFRPPSRVSIADILSSTKQKNRNEITITPVCGTPPVAIKNKEDVVLLDDDDGEGGDRLVIDEGSEEVPPCQGCRHKSAQFVCAGCGNQWYCSRDCQVTAWEEHSEVCTG